MPPSAARPERNSPRLLARIYGSIGLFGIAAGYFDIEYVRNHIVINGDAAAILHNLLVYGPLFRAGIALHLLMVLLNVVAEVIAYDLLRRVNPLVAIMALGCALVGASVESLDMLGSLVPLQIAGSHAMAAFNPFQKNVLSYLSLQLQELGLLISFLFWGLNEVLTGYLIFRSGFLPRILGILLSLSGFVYLIDPLLSFGAPAVGETLFPAALALCLPGELLIALWTATVGLDAVKWAQWEGPPHTRTRARAGAPRGETRDH